MPLNSSTESLTSSFLYAVHFVTTFAWQPPPYPKRHADKTSWPTMTTAITATISQNLPFGPNLQVFDLPTLHDATSSRFYYTSPSCNVLRYTTIPCHLITPKHPRTNRQRNTNPGRPRAAAGNWSAEASRRTCPTAGNKVGRGRG